MRRLAAGLVAVVVVLGAACGGEEPEPVDVLGSVSVLADDYGPTASNGDECEGGGGFSDMGPSTPVLLETAQGQYVDRTELGTGALHIDNGNMRTCRFTFDLAVVEGADDGEGFTIEVGDRGPVLFSYEELLAGPELVPQ